MTRLTKASLLFFFLALCASAAVVTHHLRAQRPAPAPHDLYSIVNSQLAAFRAKDFRGAYRYAASGTQQKFTLSQFQTMIRRDYSQITHARRVEFGFVDVRGRTAVVQVLFFADDGPARTVVYSLISEGNAWKIDGAVETRVLRPHQRFAGSHV